MIKKLSKGETHSEWILNKEEKLMELCSILKKDIIQVKCIMENF